MQGREPVNMTDVARAAGVSVGTVSRAIAGSRGVSEETRRRIRELADSLGYVVSPEASHLSGGHTGRVGLVTPFMNTWFHSNMIAGVAGTLAAAGLDVLLYPIAGAQERHRFFDLLPARRKVDAVVIVAAFPVTELEWQRLDLMGVPVVVAGLVVPGRPSVGIDDDAAARQAVNHLLLLGHQRIAMITGQDPEGHQYPYHSNVARLRGFTETMNGHGLAVEENLIITVPWGIAGGSRGMDTLLSAPAPPTAVFAHSDEVAFGALQSLRRAGIPTPDAMSIVSIDDHPMADSADLTTVHQSVMEQGVRTGRLCLDLLHGRPVDDEQVIIPTHLVIRRTTAPAKSPGMVPPPPTTHPSPAPP